MITRGELRGKAAAADFPWPARTSGLTDHLLCGTLESKAWRRKTLRDWDFGKARITTDHDAWTVRLASVSRLTGVSKRWLMCSRVERSHSLSWYEAWSSRILRARMGVMCNVVRLPLSGSMVAKYRSRSSFR